MSGSSPSDASRNNSGRRFILKRLVGAGAFGEVYLAEQDSGAGFTRPVALKLLNPDVAGSRDAARRMRDEARILGRLSHRNIVSVLDLVSFGERWGVVMDFVPGADLEEVLVGLDVAGEPFPAVAAFEVGSAVCRALHAAYTASDGRGGTLRVVHRDIKPSNVRLTEDGEVKVLDFGVARVELDTRESSTKAQGWIGTERFMAPERILMEGDTLAGDVYAVGASLIELLLKEPLGRTPVLPDRHAPFIEGALDQVRSRLKGESDDVDTAVDLLRRMLASDPLERPQASEACRELAVVARSLQGESLIEFSHRFVPGLALAAEENSQVVEGVLSEHTSLGGTHAPSVAPSPLADPTYFPSADPTGDGRPLRNRLVALAVAVAFAAMLLTAVSVGVVIWLLPAGDDIASTDIEPASPSPSPAADTATVPVAAPSPEPTAPVVPELEPAQPEPAQPEPVVPAPVVAVPSPQVVQPEPVTPAPITPEPVAPVPTGPVERISRALVVMSEASSVDVSCGDRSASGTSSVRIVDFPVGTCVVRANYLGQTLTGTVDIQRATTVTCTPTDGGLSCSAS